MHRMVLVDTHAAVHVDRGVRDAVAGIGGPELRRGDLDIGREILRDAPCCLPQGEAQTLDVDVPVGQSLSHRLEATDRLAELLAGARIVGGELQRPLQHAELIGAVPQRFPQPQPLHNLDATDLAVGRNGNLGENQLSGAVFAGGVQGFLSDAGIVGSHEKDRDTVFGLGGYQIRIGLDPERHQDPIAGQHVTGTLSPGGDGPLARFAVERDG